MVLIYAYKLLHPIQFNMFWNPKYYLSYFLVCIGDCIYPCYPLAQVYGQQTGCFEGFRKERRPAKVQSYFPSQGSAWIQNEAKTADPPPPQIFRFRAAAENSLLMGLCNIFICAKLASVPGKRRGKKKDAVQNSISTDGRGFKGLAES